MLNSEQESLRTWETVPQRELPTFASETKTRADVHVVTSMIGKDDRVLDLGCGWGRITLELARLGYSVTGIDLSAHLVECARRSAYEQNLSCRFEVGSMLSLPYDCGVFERVICLWGVFNHLLTVDDQLSAFREMYRVLTLGGNAFLEMGNGESVHYRRIQKESGFGDDKRLFIFAYRDFRNTLFLHDRGSLSSVCAESPFETWRVGFKNIDQKRRLTATLYKKGHNNKGCSGS